MEDKNPQTPEAIKTVANFITPEGDIPTHANSVKQPVGTFDASLDSPAKVADACC